MGVDPEEGGMNNITLNAQNDSIDKFFIFVGSGKTAIISPFFEIEYVESTYRKTINLPRYKYLLASRIWMQKNGVQNAFDLYMESPAKFMAAIGVNLKQVHNF